MKLSYILLAAVCCFTIVGCSGEDNAALQQQSSAQIQRDDEEYSKTVYAMDTVMILKAYGQNAPKALDEAEREIARLESALDRGDPDSEIYKINDKRSAEVSADAASLIEYALSICDSTGGAFDISIAPVMDMWGFYTKDFRVPSEDELAAALENADHTKISVSGSTVAAEDDVQIDMGGIAKGYLSQRLMQTFSENGVTSAIVSLGGNVQTLGAKPNGKRWKVAIQDPDDTDSYIGSVSVTDTAVITSGGYQRFFEQNGVIYHHIIDPSTGRPADSGVKSVSVISGDGTLADGLSTALYVMGEEKGIEYWKKHDGFDVIFVTDDNRILVTEGLEDKFESRSEYSVVTRE